MEVEPLQIADVKRIKPSRIGDDRGYFSEVFKFDWFCMNVANVSFVQDNESLSKHSGTVRGLHFQSQPYEQGKLVRCIRGRLLDVAVDIRTGSSTFGQSVSLVLSETSGDQLWIPAGFAHGFITLTPDTMISYKVTSVYSAEHDLGIKWDDPAIGIDWPKFDHYSLSDKDKKLPLLRDLPPYF